MNRVPSVDSNVVRGIMSPCEDTTGRLSRSQTIDQSGGNEDDSRSTHPVDGTGPKTFPEVLKSILSDTSNKSAVAWLPHGKAFLVLDRKKFVDEVLPRYLGKATKYTSFTRKLSRWNFVRLASGPDEGAWFNKRFFRDDNVEKIRNMKCAKRKQAQKEFLGSKPLKKRPVDPSLFAQNPVSPPSSLQGTVPEMQSSSVLVGGSSYAYGGRPLSLTDTRSVVQAAMRALMQAQLGGSSAAQLQLQASSGAFPIIASNGRHVVTSDVLAALQAASCRRGSPSNGR